jgi:hypothetical protein
LAWEARRAIVIILIVVVHPAVRVATTRTASALGRLRINWARGWRWGRLSVDAKDERTFTLEFLCWRSGLRFWLCGLLSMNSWFGGNFVFCRRCTWSWDIFWSRTWLLFGCSFNEFGLHIFMRVVVVHIAFLTTLMLPQAHIAPSVLHVEMLVRVPFLEPG